MKDELWRTKNAATSDSWPSLDTLNTIALSNPKILGEFDKGRVGPNGRDGKEACV